MAAKGNGPRAMLQDDEVLPLLRGGLGTGDPKAGRKRETGQDVDPQRELRKELSCGGAQVHQAPCRIPLQKEGESSPELLRRKGDAGRAQSGAHKQWVWFGPFPLERHRLHLAEAALTLQAQATPPA